MLVSRPIPEQTPPPRMKVGGKNPEISIRLSENEQLPRIELNDGRLGITDLLGQDWTRERRADS